MFIAGFAVLVMDIKMCIKMKKPICTISRRIRNTIDKFFHRNNNVITLIK